MSRNPLTIYRVRRFERRTAARKGVSVKQFHAWGRWGAPCDCDSDICEGFQWLHAHDEWDMEVLCRRGLDKWVRGWVAERQGARLLTGGRR